MPSFTLMPKRSSLLLKCLASAGLRVHQSPQSSLTGCAKPAEGRTETSGRLLRSFLNLFLQVSWQTNGETRDKRDTGVIKTLEAKTAAFIPILTNMCEHLDDGETVSGTRIETKRRKDAAKWRWCGWGREGGRLSVGWGSRPLHHRCSGWH